MTQSRVVLVGGGLGAHRVATQLRQRGHAGPITVVGAEQHLPYDRPPLSKQVLRGERDTTDLAGTDQLDVEWRLGERAVDLATAERRLHTDAGARVDYDVLVLATGGRPRSLPSGPVTGALTLRTLDDALALRGCLGAEGPLIVVGGGFIGCEVAASARQLGQEVELVEALEAPLVRVLGKAAATELADVHIQHGVRMHVGSPIAEVLRDQDANVRGVRLADETTIEGTTLLLALGITPDVEWLAGSGVDLDDGILCDAGGRTSADGVFAVGDAAKWWHPLAGRHRRVEHWTSTTDQAAVVAAAIVADDGTEPATLTDPPYFWSDQYDLKIQAVGFVDPGDDVERIVVRDRPVYLYGREDLLRAVVGFKNPVAVMKSKALVARGATVREAIDLLTS